MHQQPLLLKPRKIRLFAYKARLLNACSLGFVALSLLAFSSGALAQPIARPIPFTLPTRDTTTSPYLPQLPSEPAGSHGALNIGPDGHVHAADGTRLKFFGTSLALTAEFLTGADARLVTRRLRKLGFNAVKFVYNDNFGYDDASFVKANDSTGKPSKSSYLVNPPQFAKFDTLLFEMKKNGIYAFILLNSYHHYAQGEGVAYPDSEYSNAYLSQIFDPGVAALQRKWAKTLLGHTNPLTGLRLADDPQIAVVECNQEHSLFYYWTLDRLNYIDDNNKISKGKQTVSFWQSRFLDSSYNLYLKKRYGSDAALNSAWIGTGGANTKNQMDNASFENPASPVWAFATRNGAQAFKVEADGGVDSQIFVKVRLTSLGGAPASGNVAYTNLSARIGKDSLYEVIFWAKMAYDGTNRPGIISRKITLLISQYTTGNPRSLNTLVTIDTAWKQYAFTFRCTVGGLQNVSVQCGAELGDVWLDAFHLHHKSETGLIAGESLTNLSVKRLLYKGLSLSPLERVRCQMMFIDSIERSFYLSMLSVIKDTMHFKGLVNFTQNNYWGLLPDVYKASGGDVTEYHNGWDYLGSRPGKNYSDSTWMIRNTSMLRSRSGGTLGAITSNAASDKAFVLGEYYVPAINQYSAEQMLLIPAYADYQDWDGIFFTPYAWYRQDLFADSVQNAFHSSTSSNTIAGNSAMLALAPTASAIFRNGLVSVSGQSDIIAHDPDDVWLTPVFSTSRGSFGVDGGLDNNVFSLLKLRQQFNDAKHKVAAEYAFQPDTSVKHSDSGELVWDETNGLFTIASNSVIGAAGFFGSDTAKLPGLQFARLDASRDLLTFYLLPTDTNILSASKEALLTISTRSQNSGLVWVDSLGFGKNWGTTPTLLSAAKVLFQFKTQHDSVILYPLDNRGLNPGNPMIAIRNADGTSSIIVDQLVTPSVWYRVVMKDALPNNGIASSLPSSLQASLSQNPAREATILKYSLSQSETVSVKLIDDLGRITSLLEGTSQAAGEHSLSIQAPKLANGHYLIRLTTPRDVVTLHLNIVK
jgi:hypothetical protein